MLDARIKLSTDTPWLGTGAWDDAAVALHTRTATAYTGTSLNYQVSLTKSGGASSETVQVTMPNASNFPAGWGLHFYDSATSGTDITSQVLGDGYPVTLVSGQTTTLSFVVDVPTGAATDDQATVQVKATQVTTSETVASDKVQGVTVARVAVQPDLSVRLLSDDSPDAPWVGGTITGLSNGDTKPEEKLSDVTMSGVKRSYAMQLTNSSATAGEFKLDLSAAPTGWTAQFFQNLDADHNFSGGAPITFDAQTGGPTVSVAVNTTLELRLELTAGATTTSNYEAKLRASCSDKVDQVSVVEQIQSIAHLEWSYDGQDDHWYLFDPQNPPEIEQLATIGVRARKSIETEPWPLPRSTGPTWTWQGDDVSGEVVWLQGKNVTPETCEPTVAEFGNSLTAPIRVLPTYDTTLSVSQSVVLAGDGPAALKTVTLSARVVDEQNDTPQAGVKVRFRAYNSSGAVSGEIGTSLPSDDVVLTDAEGVATAVWNRGVDTGEITVEALPLDEKGRASGPGDVTTIRTSKPYAAVAYGYWTQNNGEWSRVVAASTWFNGQKVPGCLLTLGSLIAARETPGPLAGWENTAPFDAATGTTDADGNFTTVQRWNPVDAGALPDNYKIDISAVCQ